MLLNYLVLIVGVLISVAFITLMEQKILAAAQIRVGPNQVGYWGLLQPFADAVKLFSKESVLLLRSNSTLFLLSPSVSLTLSLVLWFCVPLKMGSLDYMFSVLFFMCVSSAAVYPILSSGWSSNCTYSSMGSLRGVAQMISYEVSLVIILLSIVWISKGFDFEKIMASGTGLWGLFLLLPLGLVWFVSSLAETNRTPYDFSEGESELVSGFNTEYSSGGFTLIFMAEYASILFMSVLFVILFLSSSTLGLSLVMKSVIVSGWFICARAALPRYRFDKLMALAWKSLLPVSLFFFFCMAQGLLSEI